MGGRGGLDEEEKEGANQVTKNFILTDILNDLIEYFKLIGNEEDN